VVFLIQRAQNKEARVVQLARLAAEETDLRTSHSVEEAENRHAAKHRKRGGLR
jgi:hypothetical protein